MKSYTSVYLGILIMFMLLPSVMSAPPVAFTSSVGGLQLETPGVNYLSTQENHRFHVHVINSTRAKTNLTTNCQLHFYNTTGTDTALNPTMEFETYNGIDFALTVDKGNYTRKGYYSVVIQCNSTNEVGFIEIPLTVTKSGKAEAGDIFTSVIWISFIFSIILLFYCFFITLAKLVTAEETIYDVLLSWASYILLIIVNYLGTDYLLRTYIEDISGQLLTLTVWTNGVLPLIAFIITFFIKSTMKKKTLSPQEVGGFRYG